MNCEACGREAEVVNNSIVQGHHLGCPAVGQQIQVVPETEVVPESEQCAVSGCDHPVREWSGRGAKPRYCIEHTTGKKG